MSRENEMKADRWDRIYAALYFLVGYGFIYTFSSGKFGRNLAIFTAAYIAAVLSYHLKKGKKLTTESVFWAAVVAGIGIPGAFWSIMPFLQVLALMAAAAYWTLAASGSLLGEGKTSQWIFFDLWNAGIFVPFSNFGCQLRVLLGRETQEASEGATPEARNATNGVTEGETHTGAAHPEEAAGAAPRSGRGKYAAGVVCGLVLTAPVLMIVLPLLSSADAGFEAALNNLGFYLSEHFLVTFLRIMFSLSVSAYLFGLAYGGINGRGTGHIHKEKVRQAGQRARLLPDLAFYIVLGIVCLVYLAFIWMQAGYLFSAFAGIRPEAFTYAEYARRGFFELCAISVCNLFFLFCAGLFSERRAEENPGLRAANTALSAFTLLLIATAMSKLGMYIDVYGLTVNRILPMVFMIWTAVVYVAFIIRQKVRFPMVKICIMTGAVLFVLLCVIPVEDCVYAYNVWARSLGLIQ